MTTRKPSAEYVSLAPLFGENSVEAWTRTLLEDRRWCRDCKAEIAGFGGAMEFRGRPPHLELVGHLCKGCWERRGGGERLHAPKKKRRFPSRTTFNSIATNTPLGLSPAPAHGGGGEE